MRKILTSALVVLICLTAFITGYCKGCYSYAEDIHYMSDEELEAAYQAYLQSKGGGLLGNAGARLAYTNGKMLNFLTSEANTTPFKNINAVKGLMRWQKTELESGNSSVLQLSMSQGGASVFSLYTQWLLQNHYFGNGVTENSNGLFNDDIDNSLYVGKIYFDADNNYCLCYFVDGTNITKIGTPIRYTSDELYSLKINGTGTITWNLYDTKVSGGTKIYSTRLYGVPPYPDNIGNSGEGYYGLYEGRLNSSYQFKGGYYIRNNAGNDWIAKFTQEGFYTVTYNTNTNEFYLSVICNKSDGSSKYGTITKVTPPSNNGTNTNVNFITNNNNNINVYPTINEGDTLYITPKVDVGLDGTVNYQPYTVNEGDDITNIVNNYYIDSGTPDKTISIPSNEPNNDNPSGGGGNDNPSGGGGNDNPNGNPSGGTPPNWNNPYPNITQDSDGVFNFNFHLPDLNIDWNINGLQEKFPFSIPFDLIRFINVLNAEPQTPEFDFTIDLKIYQWHIEADLHQFDNLAGIVRNVEFIGFCISLVLITRKMIKG